MERGQATIEWVALMLAVALALGGALGVAHGADFGGPTRGPAHDLGETLAGGLVCAARDACRAERTAMRALEGGPLPGGGSLGGRSAGGGSLGGRSLRGRPARGRSLRARRLRAWTSAPPDVFGGRGIRPSAPWERVPRGLRGLEGASSNLLRRLGGAGEFGWVACLGYRQLRYDMEHPRTPRQSMPVDDVLDELNECFNPVGWLLP